MRYALLVLVAGCSSADIDRGVCGNGIVEAGEDCDAADSRCNECGIVCASTQDCLDYDAAGGTAGFVCGPDGFCHAPAGAFERAGDVSLPVTSFRITDTNFDGVGDVLAESQTAVHVMFGDATASMSTTADVQTPFPQGAVSYADLDGDGSLDVIAPTADGIVAYTTPFGVPSPYPFPSFIPEEEGVPLYVHPMPIPPPEAHMGIIGMNPATSMLELVIIDVTASSMPVGSATICGGALAEFDPNKVEVFPLGIGDELMAVTLGAGSEPPRLCILDVRRTSAGPTQYTVTEIAPPPGSFRGRGVLANLRGAACPSLLRAQGPGATVVEYEPARATPPCGFVGTPTALADAPLGGLPIGSVPLVPSLPGFSGTAIALSSGIFKLDPVANRLTSMYRSDRVLRTIQFTNLDDHDLDIDAVAIGEGTDDLDLLYRDINGSSGFTNFRFDTENPIGTFLIGDYNGDEKTDIAYIERGVASDKLQIAYGTGNRPSAPITVGTFQRVLSLVPVNIPDFTDQTGVISDLAVLFDTGAATQLALLHGSTQGSMLAYFDPRDRGTLQQSMFRGVVAGDFSDGLGAHDDVLAIEQAADGVRLYVSSGANGGDLQIGALPSTTSVIAACAGVADRATLFCIENAQYLAWPGNAGDVVLGVDVQGKMIVLDPRKMQPSAEAPIDQYAGWLRAPASVSVRGLQQIRLADGSLRLLVSLGSPFDAADRSAAVNLCTMDLVTGPSCVDVGEAIAAAIGEPVTCVDAGVANVTPAARFEPPARTAADLLVACRRPQRPASLFRVAVDGAGIGADIAPLLDIGNADQMQVGDVTGDGIADVVLLDRNFAVPVMRVFRQCTSRDPGCGTVALGDMAVGP